MMPLLRLDKVSLVYGPRPLLDHVQLDMRSGERVCLVGRNGEGKSSLMRIGNGELAPDDGEVWRRPGVRIAHLAQEASVDSEESVFDIVAGGLAESGKLLSQYHRAAAALAHDHSTQAIARLSDLQQQLEAEGAWTLEPRVEQTLSRLGLDGAVSLRRLWGGWRRASWSSTVGSLRPGRGSTIPSCAKRPSSSRPRNSRMRCSRCSSLR